MRGAHSVLDNFFDSMEENVGVVGSLLFPDSCGIRGFLVGIDCD